MSVGYQTAVGVLLRRHREARGLSLRAVGEAVDASDATVGTWERGTRAMKVEALVDLARLYQVPVGDLLPVTDSRGLSVIGAGQDGLGCMAQVNTNGPAPAVVSATVGSELPGRPPSTLATTPEVTA